MQTQNTPNVHGRARIIMTTPNAYRAEEFMASQQSKRKTLIANLSKAGLNWEETVHETHIDITWHGCAKHPKVKPELKRAALPSKVTLLKCLTELAQCEPDAREYWEEMVRLTSENEAVDVQRVTMLDKNEKPFEAVCIVRGSLAVHAVGEHGVRWRLSHIASGRLIRTFDKHATAMRALDKLAMMPEWSAVTRETKPSDISPEFATTVKAVLYA